MLDNLFDDVGSEISGFLSDLTADEPDEAYRKGYKKGYNASGLSQSAHEFSRGVSDGERDRRNLWDDEAEDWRF